MRRVELHGWKLVRVVLGNVVALAIAFFWTFFGAVAYLDPCEDSCDPYPTHHTWDFVPVVVGVAALVAVVPLSFTGRRRAYWLAWAVAVVMSML